MAVLVVTDDLIFSSKIEASAAGAGVPLKRVYAASRLAEAFAGDYSLAIVDLNMSDAGAVQIVGAIRRQWPQLSILGYCSHAQVELQNQARAAGCTQVVARSAFVRFLPQFLTGKLPMSAQ